MVVKSGEILALAGMGVLLLNNLGRRQVKQGRVPPAGAWPGSWPMAISWPAASSWRAWWSYICKNNRQHPEEATA